MVEQLLIHIQRHQLCKTSDKILLAVSGGMDSMVMLHLFMKAGFTVGVAHCNFQLREKDSDLDETLVRDECALFNIPFFNKRFKTREIAAENGSSIQLTARELRYSFFQETADQHHFSLIATAHHVNDNLETILLNLIRGTGLDGMTGIPVKNGNIIRPLLFASRESLNNYAASIALKWREDSSNLADDYSRNFLRHQVIPKLKEINPNLENTLIDSIERIRVAYDLSRNSFTDLKNSLTLRESDNRMTIDKQKLQSLGFPEVILWEILKVYGFNYDQCKLIVKEHQSGKRFTASEYYLFTDRSHYILEKIVSDTPSPLKIEEGQTSVVFSGRRLEVSTKRVEDFELLKQPHLAQLDADKVKFPLLWRSWRAGDSLMPLGMQRQKKISDFLIDEQVSMPDKERVTVIESGNDIIWLVGMRIHNHYKVTDQTKSVLILEVVKV